MGSAQRPARPDTSTPQASLRFASSEFRLGLAVAVVFSLGWAYLATRDLFVMTEARSYSYWSFAFDPLRFLLFPVIDWGNGRLTGRAIHNAVGFLCGTAAPCHNGFTAAQTAVAAAAMFVHGYQLLRRAGQSLLVVVLWVLSAAMLATWMWQATRFEVAAVTMAAITGTFWWWALGRPTLGRWQQVGFVILSCGLLVVSFNAKEVDWVLVGVLPLLAVVRGVHVPGGVRRNLRSSVVPVAYGAWFVGWSLTHQTASQQPVPLVDGTVRLVRAGMGLGRRFMYVEQRGPSVDPWQTVATAGYLVLLVVLAMVTAAALVRLWRRRSTPLGPSSGEPRWRRWTRAYGTEAYLALLAVAPTLAGGRAATGASAYYLLLPYWAFLVLCVLSIRRMTSAFPRRPAVTGALVVLYLVPAMVAYGSLFAGGSTYRQLSIASKQMADVGGSLRQMLAGRDVRTVAWRTEGVPATGFFLLRDPGQRPPEPGVYLSGRDLWPFLVGGAADVVPILEGDATEIRDRLADYAVPGQVVVVIDEDYRLLLVAHEGRALFDAGA